MCDLQVSALGFREVGACWHHQLIHQHLQGGERGEGPRYTCQHCAARGWGCSVGRIVLLQSGTTSSSIRIWHRWERGGSGTVGITLLGAGGIVLLRVSTTGSSKKGLQGSNRGGGVALALCCQEMRALDC